MTDTSTPAADWAGRSIHDKDGKPVGAVVTTYRDADGREYALVRGAADRTARVPLEYLREAGPEGLEMIVEGEGLEVSEVATFRLLEEVPEVAVRREALGAVTVRREVETRTETVQVELVTETLVITRSAEAAGVVVEGGATPPVGKAEPPRIEVDGQPLEPGAETRVVFYREEADVRKLAVVREQVSVRKNVVRERHEIPVELGREVLRVESTGEAIVREETAAAGGNG